MEATTITDRPVLTPAVVRRLAGWSQVRVAASAGTSVSTVRIFEIDSEALSDVSKRRRLSEIYARMRASILRMPR
jgi:hypothetical protein